MYCNHGWSYTPSIPSIPCPIPTMLYFGLSKNWLPIFNRSSMINNFSTLGCRIWEFKWIAKKKENWLMIWLEWYHNSTTRKPVEITGMMSKPSRLPSHHGASLLLPPWLQGMKQPRNVQTSFANLSPKQSAASPSTCKQGDQSSQLP